MKRYVLAMACLLAWGLGSARAQPQVISIATSEPEGSAVMGVYRAWAKQIEKSSGGKLAVKLLAGGVAGDQSAMPGKVHRGAVSAAAFTDGSLRLLARDLTVLDLPGLFASDEELDGVRAALDTELRAMLDVRQLVLLAWHDSGPSYVFSTTAIKTKAELVSTKLAVVPDDALAKAVFGLLWQPENLITVRPGDLLLSLQRDRVKLFSTTPRSIQPLRANAKSVSPFAVRQGVGALVMGKAQFSKLSPAHQKLLLAEAKGLEAKLLATVRADNASALTAMKQGGLVVMPLSKSDTTAIAGSLEMLRTKLDGAAYSKTFREQVERTLGKLRTKR